jgi:hypothetical protein
MAESRSRGRRSAAPQHRGLPARGCNLAVPLERLLAPRAGRMVRDRGEAASEREVHPCPVCRRRADGVRQHRRRQSVLSVLGKRLARYGLTLHPDKTRLVDFRPKRSQGACHPETDGTTFELLGLTDVWGRSRNGKDMVRQVTAKGRFARAVAAVNATGVGKTATGPSATSIAICPL